MKYKIIKGNCLEKLKELPGNSVDSIVTDPPYELGFMGKSWDSTGIANNVEMWKECLRVLKPGGYLLSFGGTRTYHRMAAAIEDAGFEVRDIIEWCYGSGFPKSLNIAKMLDKRRGTDEGEFARYIREHREKAKITKKQLNEMFGYVAGASWWEANGEQFRYPNWTDYQKLKEILNLDDRYDENLREMVGEKIGETIRGNAGFSNEQVPRPWKEKIGEEIDITAPKTEQAKQWEGWGTALKPAHEPICMARKPLSEKTVAENCLKWKVGGINIDASRVSNDLPESDDNNACKDLYHKDDQKNHKQSIDRLGESVSQPLSENDQTSTPSLNGQNLSKSPDCLDDYSTCRGQCDEQSHLSEVGDQVSAQAQNDARKSHDHLLSKQPCNRDLSNSYSKSINIDRQSQGRFPANLIHDNSEEVRECFPDSKGNGATGGGEGGIWTTGNKQQVSPGYVDSGNASRFFKSIIYTAKASKSERNKGCEKLDEKPIALNTGVSHNVATLGRETKYQNNHPTVKPIALMEYLIKMVTPKGGVVLDPFTGSGSTGVAAKKNGYGFIGIELNAEYIKIAEKRISEVPISLFANPPSHRGIRRYER